MEVLTKEQFAQALPKKLVSNISEGLMVSINEKMEDPILLETFKENLISYTSVMSSGRFKLSSYVDAVKYVSHKFLGSNNEQAYAKTFPERYQILVEQKTSPKDISSYVSAYNSNKLVSLIFEQTLIPSYIANADIYQKAVNIQADLMMTAKSEKVRTDAANSLLNHLKLPESAKVELEITLKEDSAISELKASTLELIKQQREMIKKNQASVSQIAQSALVVEGEVVS